jgi:hypothetical protein
MKRDGWLAGFARRIGTEPPSSEEIRVLLEIAATAAHASERTAAPIACWLAGRSDLSLDQLRSAAEAVAGEQAEADGE